MIDTIVLRINHIQKYPKIYEQFYAPQKKKGTITQAYVDKDTGEILENSLLASFIFHDTNRILPLMHRSHSHVASSHYSLSYCLNPAADCLEFNFSIPKYLYSTNVLQFINIHDQSSHVIFLELMHFINKFLKENFIHTPLYEDVEIHRLDLCYNQFFNSQNDALQYLDEQKKLLSKYARSSKNNFRSYDTSLMYITRRYSFKIYHKGTEFKKKDYKELVKLNPKGLPLQYLQDQANNILRYEMTFRKSMMNYLVQHYFNASKTEANYTAYAHHPYTKFCRWLVMYAEAKTYDRYVRTQKSFTIKSEFDMNCTNDVIFDSKNITFDETVFTLMHNTFIDKIKQYQVVNACSVAGVVDKINQHNENNELKNTLRRKKENNLGTYRLISAALLIMKGFKIDEFKQYMPQSSLYRLKADLKKVGVTDKHADLNMPVPRIDYLDYKIYFKQFH